MLLREKTNLFEPNEIIGYKSTPTSTHLAPFTTEFFVVNPIVNNSAGATIDNLGSLRNFIVEFDELSIAAQEKIIEQQLALPFNTKVFSGRRSLHYIFSLDEPVSLEEYESLAQLILLVVGPKADKKMSNPNRLSRTPGERRNGVGAMQELLASSGMRLSLTDFVDLLSEKLTRKKLLNYKAYTLSKNPKLIESKWRSLPKRYLELIEEGTQLETSLSRHDCLVKLAVAAKRAGFYEDEILGFLTSAAENSGISGRGDVESIMKWLNRRIT